MRVTRVTVLASVGLVVAAIAAFAQGTPEPRSSMLVTRGDAAANGGWVFQTPTPAPTVPVFPTRVVTLDPELLLPAGVGGVHLSAIPDWLLNDPPATRFRIPVHVRGKPGLATADAPAAIAWTEGGFWYELSSNRLTVPQLIHYAGVLR